jgi:integrase
LQPVKIKWLLFLRPFLGGTAMAKAKKLPSGKWRALVYDYTDSNGKRKYQSFTAETKKEAEFLAADYSLNKKLRSSTHSITLYDGYTRYIESKNNVLSPSTLREYKRQQKHDFPELMPLPIQKITQENIQIAVNRAAGLYSPKTVHNMHGLLVSVLSMFLPNFRVSTTLPQKIKKKVYVPDDKMIKSLMDACTNPDLLKAIILASIGTLRRSEISALLESDLVGNSVKVDKAMVKDSEGKWVVKPPKTEESTRTIGFPPETMKLLREGLQEGERVVNLTPNSITDAFAELRNKVTTETFGIHKLRHYSASIMHALNVPDIYIMERGGWKSRETLQKIYTHALDDQKTKNDKIVLEYFSEL